MARVTVAVRASEQPRKLGAATSEKMRRSISLPETIFPDSDHRLRVPTVRQDRALIHKSGKILPGFWISSTDQAPPLPIFEGDLSNLHYKFRFLRQVKDEFANNGSFRHYS
jgi:hypothetical protein